MKRVRRHVYTRTDCVDVETEQKVWLRIGNAYEERDGSISVELHSLPMSGKYVIRPPIKKEEKNSG